MKVEVIFRLNARNRAKPFEVGEVVDLEDEDALHHLERGNVRFVEPAKAQPEPALAETQPELEVPAVSEPIAESEAEPASEPVGEDAPRSRRGRSR